MGRAKWKGNFIEKVGLHKLNTKINNFKLWSRRSVVTSNFISQKLFIHGGNSFRPLFINREKVGFKFGEFSISRNTNFQKKKKIKKKTKNKT
jgi:small subunit ribosomal protein S19